MAVSVQPYRSLAHTLKMLKRQVIDSIPYVPLYVPEMENPEELYYWLNRATTFKNDPKGVELLQTTQTLLDAANNRHGWEGLGDCDCFTITGLACFEYFNFKPCYVMLAGNSRLNASHIYPEVFDKEKGKIMAFDITNKNKPYGYFRSYKYCQRLNFNI